MRYNYLGIREFAEKMFRHGGIASGSGIPSLSKALEGTRLHRSVQKKYSEEHNGFVSERKVMFEYSEGCKGAFVLDGRIDGTYKLDSVTVVVEIKSVDKHPAEAEIVHVMQGAIYAYILSRSEENAQPDNAYRVELVYGLYSDFGNLVSFSFDYTREELRNAVEPALERYSDYVAYLETHREKLKAQIDELKPVYDSFRDGQYEMAKNVFFAVKHNRPMLLINAPTGIGKTFGTLFPAIKAMKFKSGYRSAIFYLTSKNEGARPPEELMRIIGGSAPDIRTCSITSKSKLCLFNKGSDENGIKETDGGNCDPENCPYAASHFDNVNEAIKEAVCYGVNLFDRAYVTALAEKHMVCPFELMLDLSLFCDVIIGDYNYVFDSESYLKRWFGEREEGYVFLIDEAHSLPDRVRNMYGAALSAGRFSDNSKRKKRYKIGKLLIKASEETVEREIIDDGYLGMLEEICAESFKYLEKHPDETLRNFCFDIIHFLNIAELIPSGCFKTIQTPEEGGTVNILCMDPSEIIKERCALADCSVLFSGSLLPKEYFIKQLGSKIEDYYSVSSPFPKENLFTVAGTFADTRYKVRETSYKLLASFIQSLGKALKKGNYIVFFSSYKYMRSVCAEIDGSFMENYVAVQPSGNDHKARQSFIDGFTEDASKLHIGMCVLGGSFAEGMDLPGKRLTGVIIVGTGLPQKNIYTDLLKDYYDRLCQDEPDLPDYTGNGFKYACFYPGVNKIIQAAGRVIRTETDKGFVALIDARYRNSDYIRAIGQCFSYRIESDPQKTIDAIVDFTGSI